MATESDGASTPEWRAWLRRAGLVSLWMLVVTCFGYATIRALGLERTWYGYTLIAFTPYVAVASFAPLVLSILWRRWIAAGVALATTVSFALVLAPRAFGEPDPDRGPVLNVMSANMDLGGADPIAIMHMVIAHDIDVLAVQEFTPHAQAVLKAAGVADVLPYSEEDPADGAAGSAIFSRYPLSSAGHTALRHTFLQAYATVSVPGAPPVYVRSVHTRAPQSAINIPAWRRDLAAEPPATPDGQLRLLVGDFNSTLDHAALRNLVGTGYHDAASQLGDGFVTTWPYDGRFVPRIVLDHVLVDPRVGVTSYSTEYDPQSDHHAIFARLTLPNA